MPRKIPAHSASIVPFESPFLRTFTLDTYGDGRGVYDCSFFHTYFLTAEQQVARADTQRVVLPVTEYESMAALDVELVKLARKATGHSGRQARVFQSQLNDLIGRTDFDVSTYRRPF